MTWNRVNWRKSSFSGAGNDCVELAIPEGRALLVRDTKSRDAGTLRLGGVALDGLRAFALRDRDL